MSVEILSPAGAFESVVAAVCSGANAVYVGGNDFSARKNATNFNREQLEQAAIYCHARGVKIYQAVNTLVFDKELENLANTLKFACKIGIDGIISQDLAVAKLVKKLCPTLPIHASTQMTIHTKNGTMQALELGFCRAVLARELSLETIKEICKLPIEIECFVHGAMCMSVSGQCYMSALIGTRSANRGMCAQACRLNMSAIKNNQNNRHDLSLKDMCLIDYTNELIKAGVVSLKIEGRMKRPEYVALTANAYKNALEDKPYDIKTLENIFSRNGFTQGYLLNQKGKEMFGFRGREDVESSKKEFAKAHELYRHERKFSKIDFILEVKKDSCTLTATDQNNISCTVSENIAQKAINKPITEEFAKSRLSKLGSTIFEMGNFEFVCEKNLTIASGDFNLLKNRLIEKLMQARTKYFTQKHNFTDFNHSNIIGKYTINNINNNINKKPKFRIECQNLEQLKFVDIEKFEYISIPLEYSDKIKNIDKNKIIITLPAFMYNEQDIENKLVLAKSNGFSHILADNIAHIYMGNRLGFTVHGGMRLNITNSVSLGVLKDLKLADSILSMELTNIQASHIKNIIPKGLYVYGYMPAMLTVNCPSFAVKNSCKDCRKTITDQKGECFKISCHKNYGYVEILNSAPLWCINKLDKFQNINYFVLKFTNETPQQVKETTNKLFSENKNPPAKFTGGLYFRGVK